MFNSIAIEADYQRQQMLREAAQRRLVREFRQSEPRRANNRLSLNALLSVIRPVQVEPYQAPRVALKSR